MKNGPYELIIAPPGYPGKHYRDRYAYEHVVVWWQNTGTLPPPGYEIHHLDMDHRHNVFSNLQLLTSEEHKRLHGQQKKLEAQRVFQCGFCGKKKTLRQSVLTLRMNRNKFGKVFCSARCGAKHQYSGVGD